MAGWFATRWKQLWCPHENVIKGSISGDPWWHCITCGRRTGAPKVTRTPPKISQPWAPPNFPPKPPLPPLDPPP